MSTLGSAIIFLAAAVVAVPIFKRFKLGAILGYLVAGAIIGPSSMDWVSDPETILHFAEFGIVLLLFVIGLELKPETLWRMRHQIMFIGGAQLLTSASIFFAILYYLFEFSLASSCVIGLAVALSSTAFAVQLMNEQRILKTPPGQKGFSILLMQDLAVIPILLLVEGLSPNEQNDAPVWWVSVMAIAFVLICGRYLINPFLRLISAADSDEVMTAAALLIVIATALGMQEAGLSMGMGAFVAGLLLANSSFRHQLEAEIEPFKGLLLGLFFIAIGMNLDLGLLVSQPLTIISASILLVLIKCLIIYVILKMAKQSSADSIRLGLMLSQGGEFAFVVMAQATGNGLIDNVTANQITLIVGMSMALTSPLVILHSLWFSSKNCPAVYDTSSEINEPQVIIAGFGRFGQITARMLAANKITFTALDKDAKHIEFVEKFGSKVFYGDACRMDLLKTAGIEHARIFLIAVDEEAQAVKIARLVRGTYPHVRIIARAKNRFTVNKLRKLGVKTSVRELFASGVEAAKLVLMEYGYNQFEIDKMTQAFTQHDEDRLDTQALEGMNIQQIIEFNQAGREELESLFQQDNV